MTQRKKYSSAPNNLDTKYYISPMQADELAVAETASATTDMSHPPGYLHNPCIFVPRAMHNSSLVSTAAKTGPPLGPETSGVALNRLHHDAPL